MSHCGGGPSPPPPHSPYAVEHVAVFGDAQQLVVGGDLVEVGPLLVGEEQVGLPDGVQHGRVEVERVVGVLAVGQPRVIPLLSQEDVHSVVLRGWEAQSYFCSAASTCFLISGVMMPQSQNSVIQAWQPTFVFPERLIMKNMEQRQTPGQVLFPMPVRADVGSFILISK